MNTTHKAATALLAAVALTGLGAGIASAAPAAAATTHSVQLFNASPYTMFVAPVDQPYSMHRINIASGQSVTVNTDQLSGYGEFPQVEVAETNGNGGVTDIDAIMDTGYKPGVTPCTPTPGRNNNGQMGCLVQQPDVLAGETGPTQISIWTSNPAHKDQPVTFDAAAASPQDRAAMGNFLMGLATFNPDFISYDPNVDTVSWGQTQPMLSGRVLAACESKSNLSLGGGATHEEATNVTGTFTLTQGIKLFDTVNTDVSVSISAGHTWTHSATDSWGVSEDVNPYTMGWIMSVANTETISGTVTATTTPGYGITFNNISFTEPGIDHNGSGTFTDVTRTAAMTDAQKAQYCSAPPTNSAATAGTGHAHVVDLGTTVPTNTPATSTITQH